MNPRVETSKRASAAWHTRALPSLALLLLSASAVGAPKIQSGSIPPGEAKNHVGEKSTVCGIVVDAHYVSSGKGQPTFLHFDEAYPNQTFTVVIWGRDRLKFGKPEIKFLEKDICITGKITSYLRIPEIVATEADQIQMRK
ncbi:MAG: hypothetical protein ACRD59_08005 [Candidatus Acidiferrales bacterium]